MSRVEVAVIQTGTANMASILAGLRRAGAQPLVTNDQQRIEAASHVVLPGVGTFGAAMETLRRDRLVEPLRSRADSDRPLLAVRVGMQVLCEGSDESPEVSGLGVVAGRITRFTGSVRVPQLGWNAIETEHPGRFLRGGFVFFANSYRLSTAPPGWSPAHACHGGRFVAALERGNILACQFHPELSGARGVRLLKRWLGLSFSEDGEHPVESLGEGRGLTRRIIPCLDVRDGRVVKGVQFSNLRDAGSPAALAALYEGQGADEIVVLDVSATPEGRATAVETVRGVREALSIPLTVGGGVRCSADAERLLEAGADKVAINTAAVARPELIRELSRRFGRQCTVLAIDAAATAENRYEVVTHSGTHRTGLDAVQWAMKAVDLGAGEILLTSWDRDGTRAGYDLALIRAVASSVTVPVIASGGAATEDHLHDAIHAGADAVLAASIFHDGDRTVADVKRALAARGAAIRA